MDHQEPLSDGHFRDMDSALSIAGGSHSLADELFDQFCAELPESMADVEAQISAGNLEKLRESLHRLRGGASVCALPGFLEVLDDLHSAAREGEVASFNQRFHRLQQYGKDLLAMTKERASTAA